MGGIAVHDSGASRLGDLDGVFVVLDHDRPVVGQLSPHVAAHLSKPADDVMIVHPIDLSPLTAPTARSAQHIFHHDFQRDSGGVEDRANANKEQPDREDLPGRAESTGGLGKPGR